MRWHVHNVFWSLFTFSPWIDLYEQTKFSFVERRNLKKVLSSNMLNLFFLNLPVDQYKENPRKRRGTTPRRKPVRQCGPTIGLCRKMLRIAVGGIFEHKLLWIWRYPVRLTYLRMFSVPPRSGIHKDRWKKHPGTTPQESSTFRNSLDDIFFLGPQGPAAPASQGTVVVSQASSFSSSRFVHKLNVTVKASRMPMLAVDFSSYGNGTRQDRFIPVSTALLKKKQLDSMYACMCMQVTSAIVGVQSITYCSAFLSSSVVSAFYVV